MKFPSLRRKSSSSSFDRAERFVRGARGAVGAVGAVGAGSSGGGGSGAVDAERVARGERGRSAGRGRRVGRVGRNRTTVRTSVKVKRKDRVSGVSQRVAGGVGRVGRAGRGRRAGSKGSFLDNRKKSDDFEDDEHEDDDGNIHESEVRNGRGDAVVGGDEEEDAMINGHRSLVAAATYDTCDTYNYNDQTQEQTNHTSNKDQSNEQTQENTHEQTHEQSHEQHEGHHDHSSNTSHSSSNNSSPSRPNRFARSTTPRGHRHRNGKHGKSGRNGRRHRHRSDPPSPDCRAHRKPEPSPQPSFQSHTTHNIGSTSPISHDVSHFTNITNISHISPSGNNTPIRFIEIPNFGSDTHSSPSSRYHYASKYMEPAPPNDPSHYSNQCLQEEEDDDDHDDDNNNVTKSGNKSGGMVGSVGLVGSAGFVGFDLDREIKKLQKQSQSPPQSKQSKQPKQTEQSEPPKQPKQPMQPPANYSHATSFQSNEPREPLAVYAHSDSMEHVVENADEHDEHGNVNDGFHDGFNGDGEHDETVENAANSGGKEEDEANEPNELNEPKVAECANVNVLDGTEIANGTESARNANDANDANDEEVMRSDDGVHCADGVDGVRGKDGKDGSRGEKKSDHDAVGAHEAVGDVGEVDVEDSKDVEDVEDVVSEEKDHESWHESWHTAHTSHEEEEDEEGGEVRKIDEEGGEMERGGEAKSSKEMAREKSQAREATVDIVTKDNSKGAAIDSANCNSVGSKNRSAKMDDNASKSNISEDEGVVVKVDKMKEHDTSNSECSSGKSRHFVSETDTEHRPPQQLPQQPPAIYSHVKSIQSNQPQQPFGVYDPTDSVCLKSSVSPVSIEEKENEEEVGYVVKEEEQQVEHKEQVRQKEEQAANYSEPLGDEKTINASNASNTTNTSNSANASNSANTRGVVASPDTVHVVPSASAVAPPEEGWSFKKGAVQGHSKESVGAAVVTREKENIDPNSLAAVKHEENYENDDKQKGAIEKCASFDSNPTLLFQYIYQGKWAEALERVKNYRDEASVWVVRYSSDGESAIRWKLLPLHLFIALIGSSDDRSNDNASDKSSNKEGDTTLRTKLLSAILTANPSATQMPDDQHMIPLHSAIRGNSPLFVVEQLLNVDPSSVYWKDGQGGTMDTKGKDAVENDKGQSEGRDSFELLEKVYTKKKMKHAQKSVQEARERKKAKLMKLLLESASRSPPKEPPTHPTQPTHQLPNPPMIKEQPEQRHINAKQLKHLQNENLALRRDNAMLQHRAERMEKMVKQLQLQIQQMQLVQQLQPLGQQLRVQQQQEELDQRLRQQQLDQLDQMERPLEEQMRQLEDEDFEFIFGSFDGVEERREEIMNSISQDSDEHGLAGECEDGGPVTARNVTSQNERAERSTSTGKKKKKVRGGAYAKRLKQYRSNHLPVFRMETPIRVSKPASRKAFSTPSKKDFDDEFVKTPVSAKSTITASTAATEMSSPSSIVSGSSDAVSSPEKDIGAVDVGMTPDHPAVGKIESSFNQAAGRGAKVSWEDRCQVLQINSYEEEEDEEQSRTRNLASDTSSGVEDVAIEGSADNAAEVDESANKGDESVLACEDAVEPEITVDFHSSGEPSSDDNILLGEEVTLKAESSADTPSPLGEELGSRLKETEFNRFAETSTVEDDGPKESVEANFAAIDSKTVSPGGLNDSEPKVEGEGSNIVDSSEPAVSNNSGIDHSFEREPAASVPKREYDPKVVEEIRRLREKFQRSSHDVNPSTTRQGNSSDAISYSPSREHDQDYPHDEGEMAPPSEDGEGTTEQQKRDSLKDRNDLESDKSPKDMIAGVSLQETSASSDDLESNSSHSQTSKVLNIDGEGLHPQGIIDSPREDIGEPFQTRNELTITVRKSQQPPASYEHTQSIQSNQPQEPSAHYLHSASVHAISLTDAPPSIAKLEDDQAIKAQDISTIVSDGASGAYTLAEAQAKLENDLESTHIGLVNAIGTNDCSEASE